MEFDPETQILAFKQSVIDGAPIYVYSGKTSPSLVIVPEETTEEMMLHYWEMGMQYLFDVLPKQQ